jgi:hypothetical protein
MDYGFNGAVTTVQPTMAEVAARLSVFAPRLVLALIVLIIGWLIALIVGNILATVAQGVGFDSLARRIGITRLLDSAGVEKSISAIVGQFATWILIFVFFRAAAEAMGIGSIEQFMDSILGYVPNVIGAAAILLIGLILANFLADTVRHAAQAGGLAHAGALSVITRNAVVTFTAIAVLGQLGIAPAIMHALVYGFIAMITIGGGLAFGLGGQGSAKRALESVEREFHSKKKL